ncbi:hypothetical protein AX15_001694 [Amanita polypyramis BW_CC]|nr:hypothetical protein AX15_001694 [Amanita polypyramis BW_CC]
MSGFQFVSYSGEVFRRSSDDYILQESGYIWEIPEDEIKDKGKGYAMVKAVVVAQMLWFALQAANRIGQGLEVELTVVAHTMINKKPSIEPRRLPWRTRMAAYIHKTVWDDGVKFRQCSPASSILVICGAFIGRAFGAVHCLAWNSSFPIHTDFTLWRVSSLAVTVLAS